MERWQIMSQRVGNAIGGSVLLFSIALTGFLIWDDRPGMAVATGACAASILWDEHRRRKNRQMEK